MDEEELRAKIREIIAEELDRLGFRSRKSQMSQAQLEQRRGAAHSKVRAALIRWHGQDSPPELDFGNSSSEARRAARMVAARTRGSHTEREWAAMLWVFGHRCLKCGATGVALHKDHVISVVSGGSDAIENLQPLCKRCNSGKSMQHNDYRSIAEPKWLEKLRRRFGNGQDHSADDSAIDSAQKRSKTKAKTAPALEDSAEPGQQMHPATAVWLRYSTAFKLRYGAFPPRNARTNSLIKQFLNLIPAGDAPDVAEFYVGTADPLYTRANHPLQLLVRDAEKLSVMATTKRTQAEAAAPRPWWQAWSGIQAEGKQLGIDEAAYDNPTRFKNDVLRAAADWGSLPVEAQIELGMLPPEA